MVTPGFYPCPDCGFPFGQLNEMNEFYCVGCQNIILPNGERILNLRRGPGETDAELRERWKAAVKTQ